MAVLKDLFTMISGVQVPNSIRNLIPLPSIPRTSRMRRNVFRMVAPELYRLKTSANMALRIMKAMNLGVNRSAALKIYKSIQRPIDYEKGISVLGPGQQIPDDLILHSQRMFPTRYGYHVSADIYNAEGKFLEREWKWFYSDQKYTKRGVASIWGKTRKVMYEDMAQQSTRNIHIHNVWDSEAVDPEFR